MNIKTEVEQQLESWKQVVISQSFEQIMACYVEDVRAFDANFEL